MNRREFFKTTILSLLAVSLAKFIPKKTIADVLWPYGDYPKRYPPAPDATWYSFDTQEWTYREMKEWNEPNTEDR